MKDLKNILSEGILDDIDNTLSPTVTKASILAGIKDYIATNYKKCTALKILGKPNADGKYIVDAGSVEVSGNSTMTDFSNGLFVWRNVRYFKCQNCSTITSTKGAPEKCEHVALINCSSLSKLDDITANYDVIEISNCNSLKSLHGLENTNTNCRIEINNCSSLTSLEGAPNECYMFILSQCSSLTSLKGAPKKCEYFTCNENLGITTLEYSPSVIAVTFNCCKCHNLTSLKGAPKKCFEFNCGYNGNLTSLEGAPENCEVFDCSYCNNLTSLKGVPQSCSTLNCNNCVSLTSLEYAPKSCKHILTNGCNKLVQSNDNIEVAYNELMQWYEKYNYKLNKHDLNTILDRFNKAIK
jgi:hypothetical protein